MRDLAWPPRPRSEWLVPLGLLVAGQLEVWIWWVEDEQGPKPLAALAITLMAAALYLLRAHPAVAAGAAAAVFAAWSLADPPAGSLMPFVILLAATFRAAQLERPRSAALGGAAALAAIWIEIAVTDNDLANYAFTGFFVVAAWLAGRGFRSRERRVGALERHALELDRRREADARAAVAEERGRIARELHDVVAHNVSVIVIQAQAAQQSAAGDGEAGRALRSIEATGQQALTEMRRLLGLLRKDDEELALAPHPSLRHLEHLVGSVRDAGLPVELEVHGDIAALPPGVDVSAYRIVQEALTNALKHAGPARARVRVNAGTRELDLEISDDGAAAPSGAGAGQGLVGMRERASLFGGVVETGARPEGGYTVRVRLPIEAAP